MVAVALEAALLSATLVALQVVLPRLFSVVLWYHLGFFAVTLAMTGLALGAQIVRHRKARGTADLAGPAIDLAGFAIVCAVALFLRVPIDPSLLPGSLLSGALLLFAALVLAVPFVLLGWGLAARLDEGRARIGRTYGATFLGGAAGAGLALAAMEWRGAPFAVGLAGALPLAGRLVARRPSGPALASLVLVAASLALPRAVLPIVDRKHFPRIPPERVLEERWNAFSLVTFYDNPDRHGLWEVRGVPRDALPPSIGVAIDRWAITSILGAAPDDPALDFLEVYPPTLGWTGAGDGFDALVVGAGGGVDVLAALRAGAGRVDAVEINPTVVWGVRERFRDFARDLYRDPRVRVHVAEGRHFAETHRTRWDRILLSGVDTFAATEAGAFALSENFLYTKEAFATWLDRLTDDGMLALARWWFEPPRQTLRLAVTAGEVLAERGVNEPWRCVFVGRAGLNSLFLVRPRPFAPDEIDALRLAAAQRGIEVVHPSSSVHGELFQRALDPNRAAALVAEYPYRIEPATDDRPFFFEHTRLRSAFRSEGDWILGRFGGVEVLLAALALALLLGAPLLVALVRPGRGEGGRLEAIPFLFLGFAYLFVEVALMQRLVLPLGHPVAAVAVVLAGLLVGSGFGSLAAERVAARRAFAGPLVAGAAVVLVGYGCLPILLEILQAPGIGTTERVVGVLAFLALPSFCMGLPFPLAVRVLARRRTAVVPRAFAANGLASVWAAPLAMLLALEAGLSATLLTGALCYAAASFGLLLLRDPGPEG